MKDYYDELFPTKDHDADALAAAALVMLTSGNEFAVGSTPTNGTIASSRRQIS